MGRCFNILLQVLEDGRLTDNKGRTAYFKNTIVIMTSNTGSDLIQKRLEGITEDNREEQINQSREEVFRMLNITIRPEFLNRVDEIIMFKPLKRVIQRFILNHFSREIVAGTVSKGDLVRVLLQNGKLIFETVKKE